GGCEAERQLWRMGATTIAAVAELELLRDRLGLSGKLRTRRAAVARLRRRRAFERLHRRAIGDLVASVALGLVERGVGAGEQLVQRIAFVLEIGDADADREPERVALAGDLQLDRLDHLAQALAEAQSVAQLRFRQQAHELLAAEAREQVAAAQSVGEGVRE